MRKPESQNGGMWGCSCAGVEGRGGGTGQIRPEIVVRPAWRGQEGSGKPHLQAALPQHQSKATHPGVIKDSEALCQRSNSPFETTHVLHLRRRAASPPIGPSFARST